MADKALIIVAHGSRKAFSNEEVKALGEKVKSLHDKHYTFVMTAFLEFAAPSLEESMLSCIKKGVNEIVILPYFLASGHHVTHDIPDVINTIRIAHPNINITLKSHLGSSPGLARLLSDMTE